jgi:hypothetical protein
VLNRLGGNPEVVKFITRRFHYRLISDLSAGTPTQTPVSKITPTGRDASLQNYPGSPLANADLQLR